MSLDLARVGASVWHNGLAAGVPLMLAATGELVVERSGVINIGIEGCMLIGAFSAATGAWISGAAGFGMLCGALAGALVGVVFAAWTVWARRDAIVTGLAINLLAIGVTGVALRSVEHRATPFVPPALVRPGGFDWMPIAAIVIAIAVQVFLSFTRPGLVLRAAGENAEAVETAGVRVWVVRTWAAVFGGALAGLAGGYLALGLTNRFQEEMTAGRGFVALALVIFGRWNPLAVAAGAILFGCLDAMQIALQPELGARVHVLYPALLALPYVLTLAALAGFAGRARGPAQLSLGATSA